MRNASSALITLLNNLSPTSPLFVADLMTIQGPPQYTNLAGGGVLPSAWAVIARITSAAVTLTSKSQALSPSDTNVYTFTGGLVSFTRGQAHWNIGFQADDMPMTFMCDPTRDTLNGYPWPEAARLGYLDGALITVERVFMPTWGDTSAGTLILFKGMASEVEATRSSVYVNIKALINQMEAPMPRNLWQLTCTHMLYDTGCTLLKSAFAVNNSCQGGSTLTFITTNLTQGLSYFDQGTITFTSGANNGISRGVYHYTGSGQIVIVDFPLPFAPLSGDTFTIAPGCDKTASTCNSRFSNIANFGGHPNIPVPETAT